MWKQHGSQCPLVGTWVISLLSRVCGDVGLLSRVWCGQQGVCIGDVFPQSASKQSLSRALELGDLFLRITSRWALPDLPECFYLAPG